METRRKLNPELPAFLYVLEDPQSPGEIRYIGQTQSLPTRMTTHVQRAKQTSGYLAEPLYQWIRELLSLGREPRIRPLWQGDLSDVDRQEVAAIAAFRRLGFPLLNQSNGGPGNQGFRPSQETRARMSRASLGKTKPPGHGAAISRALTGRAKSPEHRAALSRAHLGQGKGEKKSPEHRAAMRAGWIRRKVLSHSQSFFV